MHKKHIAIAGLAFIMCIISMYFGLRIYNANENIHLTELNELDQKYYDNIERVPALSFLAACFTLPLAMAILILELIAIWKSNKRQVKNIAIGLLAVISIILVVDILTIFNPVAFDFSKWGFVWICLGLVIVAGNMLSFAIYKFGKSKTKR